MLRKPTHLDAFFLSIFTVLITLHPYFLYGQMNLFEFGIYLPNINAVLDGLVPYRDFFHLRGPLEVYVPAFFMNLFGKNVAVLESYFYVGTVVALIICAFIGKEIFRTRFVLYLMIPVLIGRTFPRAVFTNWGGMRYALGLLAILCAIYFLKRRKFVWVFFSGIISSLALLTSIEMGVSSIFSVACVCLFARVTQIYSWKVFFKTIVIYALGVILAVIPFIIFLILTHSFNAYLDMTHAVVSNMTNVFPDHLFEPHPKNFVEAILAMNPFSPHFKHLTPSYCFLFFLVYVVFKVKKGAFREECLPVLTVAFYGFILYASAFRKIGAAQFEMALQPEKILLFFMLEQAFFYFKAQRADYLVLRREGVSGQAKILNYVKIYGINFLIFAFFMSSFGYSIARFDHRFFAYKYVKAKIFGKDTSQLIPLAGEQAETMELERVRGLTVPRWQALELRQLTEFFNTNTNPDDPVFMFPEQGAYNFILDRPFVGRFPMVSFSWIGGESWHRELLKDLKRANAKYALIPIVPDETLEKVYFKIPQNKVMYYEVWDYVMENYRKIGSTQTLFIYQRK